MIRERQYRAAERELMHVFSTGLREKAVSHAADCPSRRELQRFAAGKSDSIQRDRLLTHLATCDLCVDSMASLRQRRWITRTVFVLASVFAVIVGATWFWANQHGAISDANRVATVDLRLISPTRGQGLGNRSATVDRTVSGLRLVLPVGGEGNYDLEILGQDTKLPALLRGSGNTRREDTDIVLRLPLNLSNLKSGDYLLALRRDGTEWEYYSLHLK